jgi:hypothetical protein
MKYVRLHHKGPHGMGKPKRWQWRQVPPLLEKNNIKNKVYFEELNNI